MYDRVRWGSRHLPTLNLWHPPHIACWTFEREDNRNRRFVLCPGVGRDRGHSPDYARTPPRKVQCCAVRCTFSPPMCPSDAVEHMQRVFRFRSPGFRPRKVQAITLFVGYLGGCMILMYPSKQEC